MPFITPYRASSPLTKTVRETGSSRFLQSKGLMAGLTIAAALVAAKTNAQEESSQDSEEKKGGQPEIVEQIVIKGTQFTESTTTRLPLKPREIPQSISEVSRELMDMNGIIDMNGVMMNVTGVNVTLYDTQRPLYFARGFQITDFQIDGIPTYSNSTNQEYDTALYESIEVVRGANGLLTGVGTPSATVNMIRKRPGKDLDAQIDVSVGSWDRVRGVGDVSVPLTSDGSVRSRVVVAAQDSDSFRDRYTEEKVAYMGVIEADLGRDTTVALGYQNQNNNPDGTIWGTVPIYAADGTLAEFPVSTSFAPHWTQWQRESGTLFADINHRFNEDWTLRAAYNRTEGEVFSLRVYATGFPDKTTGEGLTLLGSVGSGEDVRNSLDAFLTGKYSAWGQEHELVIGANVSDYQSDTPGYTSLSGWSYAVPDAWNYDGNAPMPSYSLTGSFREAETKMSGVYVANRLRATDALSFIAGVRVSNWETGTDNYDTAGDFVNTTGDYDVDGEVSPYAGVVYDISETYSWYASYTDIFSPQNYKDKDNNLLSPVLGVNLETGIKAEFLDGALQSSAAIFKAQQDNLAVRDLTQPDNSLPDGSSAYVGVDGTESEGFEISVSGQLQPNWLINAGYSYVHTSRHANDLIWTNLPQNSIQFSTHYMLTDGALEGLSVGGGINWQGEIDGLASHPTATGGRQDFTQDAYTLVNLYANYEINRQWSANLSATNVTDELYWANIDYSNYGEPRNVTFRLSWKY